MKTENKVLMAQARETLKGEWALGISAYVIFTLISVAISAIPKAGFFFSLIVGGPLALGAAIFTLSFSRKQNPHLNQIFDGFKDFGNAAPTYLMMIAYIFLWSLLLIIPGIIKAFAYSMSFYILADNKSLKPGEALKMSEKMMDGNKWKFFTLQLRFIGWSLLCILTLGIGFLWLIPYIEISKAKFYDDIKDKVVSNPLVTT
jgi:uncharacterized membrane protein